MAKGLLLDFEAIAHHADGDPFPLMREIRNLGYEVYRREFLAACDYAMYVDLPRRGLDSAEHFLEAVFDHLDQKPTKTELMSLAPVFAELYKYALYDDVVRAIPTLAKGHKLGVVSCLPPFSFVNTLDPIKSHILAVVTPKEVKAVPPNPSAYKAALAALKLRARDVVLVSPHCADLLEAKLLGLHPVFVRRHSEASCPHAVATIGSFGELEAAVRPVAKAAPAPPKVPETSTTPRTPPVSPPPAPGK